MILSTLVNQYLARDLEMAEKLSEHEGKILKIELLPLRKSFFVFIHKDAISLASCSEISPHAVISGTPLGLLSAGLAENNRLPAHIALTGDVLFVHSLKNIFSRIDIDWTEMLSQWTGDLFAYAINQIFHRLNNYRVALSHSVKRNLREYLQEEHRYLVPRAELENFYKEIDELRDKLERLRARFKLIDL